MTIARLALVLIALATPWGVAQAGRPLATEDADVLARGDCEWESFVADTRARGDSAERGLITQVGCGLGAATQAALGAAGSRYAGETTSALFLVGKTALLPREGESLGITLAWGLAAERPPGGSMKQETTFLTLVASRTFAPGWTGHANLGWLHSRSASASTTTWALAAERAMGGGVDLMGEVYGDDRGKPWMDVGARWQAGESTSLNASWAVQRETPRVRLWTFGLKLAF